MAGHEVLQTEDPDEACAKVGHTFAPHRLEVRSETPTFHVRHNFAPLGSVALSYLSYGAAVRITLERLTGCYLVLIPLAGSACAIERSQRALAAPDHSAIVASPGQALTLQWDAASPHLLIHLDRRAVERSLWAALGRPPREPLRFDLGLDLLLPSVRRWLDVIALVRDELEHGPRLTTHPAALRHLQQLTISGFLVAARHTYADVLSEGRCPGATPARVRRAVDFIEDHAAEPLTVDDVAEAVGIGVRALQQDFRAHLDSTPTMYLRLVRLKRVRAELVAAAPDAATVTDIALRWGFTHLGRFTQAYKTAFGETPSATLRRT